MAQGEVEVGEPLPLGSYLLGLKFVDRASMQAALVLQKQDVPRRRIGEILLAAGKLSPEELQHALRLQKNAHYRWRSSIVRSVFRS